MQTDAMPGAPFGYPPTHLDAYITTSADTRFGKPCITGTRIAVIDIATWHNQMGLPLELIAAKYHLPLAGVYAAMAYYYDNRAEIDRRQQDESATAEELRAEQGPTKLDRLLAERDRGDVGPGTAEE